MFRITLSLLLFLTFKYGKGQILRGPRDTVKAEPKNFVISHMTGGGIQLPASLDYGYGHDFSKINYDSPLPYFFYRFVLTGKKERKTCLSINFFERKGSGSHYGGGLGGSLGVFGSFDFIRCDIGINRFWSFGKRKGTSFGMGVSMGFIPYIKANMYREESSVSWGYKTEKADAFEGISKINLTMNVEFNQRFKIYKSHAVIIGVRAALESSDGFASEGRIILRDGKVATAFLAYTFGHRILK